MDKNLSKLPASEKRFYENPKMEDIFGPFIFISTDQHTIKEKPQSVDDWKYYTSWSKIKKPSKFFRGKKHKIYVQPIGPFPEIFMKTNGFISMLETLKNFVEKFFPNLKVVFMDTIDYKSLPCKNRLHTKSKQRQLLISDVQFFLKTIIPKDAFCICGLSWFDFYPSEDLNHILGEASFQNSTVAVSFGHYAYFMEKEAQHLAKWGNDYVVERSVSVVLSNSQESLVFITSNEKCEAEMRSPKHEPVCQSIPVNHELSKTNIDENLCTTLKQNYNNKTVKECLCEALPPGYNFYLNCKIYRRLFRVITHEICHAMGMSHCQYFSCTMNTSISILNADTQPLLLCPICLRKLQLALKFDVLLRYNSIFAFLNNHTHQFCQHKDEDVCPFLKDKNLLQKVCNFMNDL
ncbi:archaemetzincin-2 isoform X1 [Hydra vulgaris]|uniref:archaemetzincin-2 isoform X1 n=1 Tax=Hydra vulgaris TaxID=6087 RepID=UPI0006415DB9|nr:archaemetzincin-2 isoform X1 [Hydra vulgaris]